MSLEKELVYGNASLVQANNTLIFNVTFYSRISFLFTISKSFVSLHDALEHFSYSLNHFLYFNLIYCFLHFKGNLTEFIYVEAQNEHKHTHICNNLMSQITSNWLEIDKIIFLDNN